MLSNILNIYCKNIFNNFLIAESCRTRTHLFQKLPSPAPAPAPESRNAPVLHRCIAYAHIPDEKRRKLDNKGEKCIFLGVSDKSKAYKLYNPSTMKIVISRDVVFDEEGT